MNKKVKKELGIILGITIIVLVATFVVLWIRAKHYTSIWDDFANIEPDEGDIAVGGLALLALMVSLVGATILALVFPTVITAILLSIFLIIVLCVKREKPQRVVVLVLLPFSLTFTIVTLLGETVLFLLYRMTLPQAESPALSVVILALLVLSAICLISSVITVIVSCARLNKYCKKSIQEPTVSNQQTILTE